MNTMRWLVASAALAVAGLPLYAQTPATDAAKTPPKKAAPKDVKKEAPAKDAAKKDEKKAAPKAQPKKDEKKTPPKKGDADTKAAKKPANTTMQLRDEKGNVIPISPDAYDVSSALPAKPKK